MFLLNSRLAHFTAAPKKGALLIPKLRSYFAEFLDQGSLLRLGILYPPTCVGLRYGLLSIHGGFSWHFVQQYGSPEGSPQNSIT